MATDTDTACSIGAEERISLTDPRLRDCLLLPGTRITVQYNRPVERPQRSGVSRMRDGKPQQSPAEVDDRAPLAPLVGPPVGPALPMPSVVVPATASEELARLVPAGGQTDVLTLVLGLVAVLGGGTAWRFYRQRSRERHEREMRELELKAGQSKAPSCQAEHAAMREVVARIEARLTDQDEAGGALVRRVARLEARGTDLELPDTVGSLEARVTKLEKAAKAAKGRAAKG